MSTTHTVCRIIIFMLQYILAWDISDLLTILGVVRERIWLDSQTTTLYPSDPRIEESQLRYWVNLSAESCNTKFCECLSID